MIETSIKKIKLEKKIVKGSVLRSNTAFDIENHELEKFLTILNMVINQIIKEGNTNNQDSETKDRIKNILVTVRGETYKFLKDIDSLNLPETLKTKDVEIKISD